jgi:hypothetical protein
VNAIAKVQPFMSRRLCSSVTVLYFSEFEEVWCDEDNKVEVENPLSLIDSDTDPARVTEWRELSNPWSIDFEDQDAKGSSHKISPSLTLLSLFYIRGLLY